MPVSESKKKTKTVYPSSLFIDNENLDNMLSLSTLFFCKKSFTGKLNKYGLSVFNFRKYTKSNKSDYLSYYLAGLIEGDGSFIVPKSLKGPTGKARAASIEIVFALKDKPLAELLKNIYGGKIYGAPKKSFVRWMIRDLKSVVNILNSINGKLRTPKINRFYNMIDFIKYKGVNIEKLPLDTSPLANNAWLAGFIDSDGHFAIKGFTANPKTPLAIQFYLPQRKLDISGLSMEHIMGMIAQFLQTKLNHRTIAKKYYQFIVNTSNNLSNKILIEYLNAFSLLSSKYLDFKDWEKANEIYTNKLHKDPILYEKIRLLKLNMNNKRSTFSWSHHITDIYNLNSE